MIGQKKFGKVMFELKYNAPKEIHYLIDWSCNDNNRLITKNLYETIINFYNGERINFLCSWFCGLEYEYFDKMGFDCHYYDVDEYVCKANRGLTDKIYNVDVIFDEVKIEEGLYVNKFCEDTYPIGKIYKGEFVLIGSDNDHLACINQIHNIDTLIEQNELTKIYSTKTFKGLFNYYMVAGCNL